MITCPNINLTEWKSLVQRVGIDAAYAQWITGQLPAAGASSVQKSLQAILPPSIGLKAIEELASDTKAWGAYRNKVIYLASNAPNGTEYHEAFHAVYRLLLSDSEIQEYNNLAYRELLSVAKEKGMSLSSLIAQKQKTGWKVGDKPSDILPEFIEEYLADKFRDYMLRPKNSTSWLSQLFARIKSAIRGLLSKQKDISTLFRSIEQGEFVKAPYQRNEFNQEDRVDDIVYQLLSKASRLTNDGTPITPKFGAEETSQIVRDTTAYYLEFKNSKIAKRDKWTDEEIIDKVLDLRKAQYSTYSDERFLGTSEYDYYNLFAEEDILEPDGEITEGERTVLKREVLAYLKNFRKLDDFNRDINEDEVDDVGDKTHLNAEMKTEGGWGTLPQFVRLYIACISYPLKTVIGKRQDIDTEGNTIEVDVFQRKTLNPTKVYNGLLRALANETSEEMMIEKLWNFGQLVEYTDESGNTVVNGGNLDTHYFVRKFVQDTGIDINRLLTRDTLSEEDRALGYISNEDVWGSILYQKMIKAFNRYAKNTIFNEFDTGKKESKVFLANRKNVGQQQFEQWHNNYKNKDIDKERIAERIKEILPLFLEASPFYQNQIAGKDFSESKTREQHLAEDIGKVNSVLQSIGIDLSPSYIKYSLLYPKYAKLLKQLNGQPIDYSEDTLTFDEVKFLTATAILPNERLDYVDLTQLLLTFSKGSNPYEKSDSEGLVDDANIGRILSIAKGNAKLDETVFDSSYVAADGTVRYLHQDGTYHLIAMGKLRDEVYREGLKATGIRDESITIGVDKNGTPINIDSIDSTFVTDNFFWSEQSDFERIANELRIEELDGLRIKQTIPGEEEDMADTVKRYPGTHFGDMSDRQFATTLFNLYSSVDYQLDKEGKKVYTVPQLISIMETSKSSDFAYLPIIKGLYSNTGPTDKLISIVKNELKKEFDRITKVYNEITENGKQLSDGQIQEKLGYVIDQYHTTGRGLRLSDKISSLLSDDFVELLEQQAQQNSDWFNTNSDQINTALSEGIKGLVQAHLDLMVTNQLFTMDKGKIINNFMSDAYFKEDDRLGFTNNFEHNVAQVITQHWINSMALSQLLHGDNALMYKNDGVDVYKREKTNNAKGPAFKHNRTVPALGVTPFEYSRMVILEEPVDTSKIDGKKIDQADAQLWGSVQAVRNALFGLGRLTPEVARVFDKMERGETLLPSDFFNSNGDILSQDRFINSYKFIFKDSKRTVKTSVVILTKELTSVKIGNQWYARPGREELHNMRESMNTTGFDFAGPKSAFKTFRANILKRNRETGQYDFSQASPERYDNAFFRLQLEVPSNKTKITTPTQLLHAIDTEQDDDTLVYVLGVDYPVTIKQVREAYQSALASKATALFDQTVQELYDLNGLKEDLDTLLHQGKVVPRLAEFQARAIENLLSNGGDPQLIEFFQVQDGEPLYNLNNDLVLEKYTQLYLSQFSKGAFSFKNPGHSVSLFSNYGMKLAKRVLEVKEDGHIVWEVIRSDSGEYKQLVVSGATFKNVKWNGRKDKKSDIRYIDPNLSVGDLFVDYPAYNVPEYEGDTITGYYSETIMPFQTLDQALLLPGQKIPKALQFMLGNRIPLQDKHSMLSLKWVDTMPIQYGSTAVYPSEVVQLSGADFDIDKEFLSIFASYVENGQFKLYNENHPNVEYQAHNASLSAMLAMLTNDYVRNGIADQPAVQDYIASGGNTESNEMNPAFYYEKDGKQVPIFGGGKRYPVDSMIGHITIKKKNNIGKDNISIDVSGGIQNSLLKKAKIKVLLEELHITMHNPITGEDITFNTFEHLHEYNFQTGQFDGRRLMDVSSGKISASTDEAKDGNNAKFNLDGTASLIASVLNGLGIPWAVCVAIVNQPMFSELSQTYSRDGLVTSEEGKYEDNEVKYDRVTKMLEDALAKNEELKKYETAYANEHGNFNNLITFDNLVKVMTPGFKPVELHDLLIANKIEDWAVNTVRKATTLAAARGSVGKILALSKGIKDFTVLDNAINAAYELGLITGELHEKMPIDVRYALTGDKQYKNNSDYVHKISSVYIKNIQTLSKLSSLNFVSRTPMADQLKSSVINGLRLRGEDFDQLQKDFLSFISIAAYKHLIKDADQLTNNLLTSSDQNITTIYKKLKRDYPDNPLMKYIITNKTRQLDTSSFYTLEANSFTRLNDMQLGNLINGYLELEQNPETKEAADAIFAYLFVKDGMQFKDRSISKVIPAEMFTNLSISTGIAHKLLLANTQKQYLELAAEIVNLGSTLFNEGDFEQLATASEEVLRNTMYDRILGYSPTQLYNRFYHLIAIQPQYEKGNRLIRPKGLGMSYSNGNYIFDLAGDVNKVGTSLRNMNFNVNIEKGYVVYPKTIRMTTGIYMLTEVDNVVNPNGVQFKLGQANEMGKRAVYVKISKNINAKWNQMADLQDLRLVKNEPVKKFNATVGEVQQEIKEEIVPEQTTTPAEPYVIDFEKLNQNEEDDWDDVELDYKSPFKNINNTTDNSNRCD